MKGVFNLIFKNANRYEDKLKNKEDKFTILE